MLSGLPKQVNLQWQFNSLTSIQSKNVIGGQNAMGRAGKKLIVTQ